MVLDMMKNGIKNQLLPTKAVDFSSLKSRASVDFGAVPLYQAKAPIRQAPGPIRQVPHRGLIKAPASWASELGAGRAGSWYKGRRTGAS